MIVSFIIDAMPALVPDSHVTFSVTGTAGAEKLDHGTLACGMSKCDDGYTGTRCQCVSAP